MRLVITLLIMLVMILSVVQCFSQDTVRISWDDLKLVKRSATTFTTDNSTDLVALEVLPGMVYTLTRVPVLPAQLVVEPELFTTKSAHVESYLDLIRYTDKDEWLEYTSQDISAVKSVNVRYALGDTQSAVIDIRAGSHLGPIVATLTLPVTGGWATFLTKTIVFPTPLANGILNWSLTFSNGRLTGNGNIEKLTFVR